MRSRLWNSLLGIVAMAAILIGINIVVDNRLGSAQLDLTQGHLYTLSQGTRAVLKGLKEPITLRLFYSPKLGSTVPSYGAYADRVREMLRRYQQISHGMVRVEFFDPEPFTDTEDRAIAYGLQGVPLDQGGEKVYFGLAGTNMLDSQRQIAFFQPDRQKFLEYDLTKLVYELSNPTRPEVGVMTSLPLDGNPRQMLMAMRGMGSGGQPWVSMLQLRQSFNIKTVPTTATVIDPKIKVLLVAQAQHLSDATLYAIDQFVMHGGHLMAMVDPYSEAEANTPGPNGQPQTDDSSNLPKLFKAWGIAYNPKQVVGDLDGAWQVESGPGGQSGAVAYVPWFNIRSGISRNDPATADLQQVTVASAGALAKAPGAKITFTPLLSSSAESEMLPVSDVAMDPEPGKILADFKPQGGPRVIAARIHGVLHSAFSGPPPLPAGQKPPAGMAPYKASTDKPANMVVVADSDILADRYWVRTMNFFGQQETMPFSDNGAFVANLIGTLTGSDALIGLRSRGITVRPFTLIDSMQARAEARYRQTEQQLKAHLASVQKQLEQLRSGGTGKATEQAVITPAQRSAIDAARHDILQTREKLRAVQLELRRDIARLEMRLRLFDIVLVPVLLALIAIFIGFLRRRRRANARA